MDNIQPSVAFCLDTRAANHMDPTYQIPILGLLARLGAVSMDWPAHELLALRKDWARTMCMIEDAFADHPEDVSSLIVSLIRTEQFENFRIVAKGGLERAL